MATYQIGDIEAGNLPILHDPAPADHDAVGTVRAAQDERGERIADTQRDRGLELDRGPLLRRVRFALAKGMPLMVQTYRMAEAISLALSLHGFDPNVRRTTWRNVGWLTVESELSGGN